MSKRATGTRITSGRGVDARVKTPAESTRQPATPSPPHPAGDWLPLGPWNDRTLQAQPGTATPAAPYRCVTLCDGRFVPGLLALLQSMKENAGIPLAFTVVELGGISPRQREAAEAVGCPIDWIAREQLGDFGAADLDTERERMRPNFHKPLIWNLPFRGPCLYVDCDVLCLRMLRGIETIPSLGVVVKQSAIARGPDDDTAYKPSGVYPFNAGVMVFQPDPAIYRELQVFARSYVGAKLTYGDQVIHNDYFALCRPEGIHWLPMEWNASTWLSRKWPDLYEPHRVRLLHYAHDAKPWLGPPREGHDWMWSYWRLWWGFYERAAR